MASRGRPQIIGSPPSPPSTVHHHVSELAVLQPEGGAAAGFAHAALCVLQPQRVAAGEPLCVHVDLVGEPLVPDRGKVRQQPLEVLLDLAVPGAVRRPFTVSTASWAKQSSTVPRRRKSMLLK